MNAPLLRRSRQWHRWGAWGLGAIVLLWTVSGLFMIMPAGRAALRPPPPPDIQLSEDVVTPQAALAAIEAPGGDGPVKVRGVSLEPLDGRLFYRFTLRRGGTRLIDARSGAPFVLDDSTAGRLARASIRRDPGIVSVNRLTKSDGEYRGSFPAFRVVFDDAARTTAYVSKDGGVSVPDSRMRLKQGAERLHTFNIRALTSVSPALRRWLLYVTSVGTVALIVTGFVLLLPVRRRERV